MTSSKRKAFPGRAEVIFEIYFLNKVVLVHIFGGPMEKYFNLCTLGLYMWLVQNNLIMSSTQNLVQAKKINKKSQLTAGDLH
jgi:hypothetical protein